MKVNAVASDLRKSVLRQCDLSRIDFSVEPGDLPPEYADELKVSVTEVLGSSPVVEAGSIYLVCGEYTLGEPVANTMVLAVRGRMTGYEVQLDQGSDEFCLYGEVQRKDPAGGNVLSVLLSPEAEEYTVLTITLKP